MTRSRIATLATLTLLGLAAVIVQSQDAEANTVAGQPQYIEAVAWRGGAGHVDCVRFTVLNYDGGVSSIPEYAEGVDGGFSWGDGGVVNNTPTLKVGERYRVVAPTDLGSGVYINRGAAVAQTGSGAVYVPVDSPEEMSFSPRGQTPSRLYGRCATGSSCAVDLCPLNTPSLGTGK
jgi:hypothetical protein